MAGPYGAQASFATVKLGAHDGVNSAYRESTSIKKTRNTIAWWLPVMAQLKLIKLRT